MNIIEAYILFNEKLIIIISGMSGCGKTFIAKNISEQFNLNYIDQSKYYKPKYSNSVTLPNGRSVINWYSDDAVDWDKLNNDVNNTKSNGIIIVGFAFPQDKIKFVPDFHINISLSKNKCIDNRKLFIERHKDDLPEQYKQFDPVLEKIKINQLEFPYFIDIKKRSIINKFINANDINKEDLLDQVWDYLINKIQEFVNWFNANRFNEWNKNKKNNNNSTDINSVESDSTDDETTQDTQDDDEQDDDDDDQDDDDDNIKDGSIEFLYVDDDY